MMGSGRGGTLVVLGSLAALSCGSSGDASGAGGGGGTGSETGGTAFTGEACASTLEAVQDFDAVRAAHGEALLRDEVLGPGVLPEFVVRNLWIAWGSPAPATDPEYWAQFRARYGMLESTFGSDLPLGMRREAGGLTFDCLTCHAGRVAGSTIVGAPNTTIDLESFYDDLLIMRDLAPSFGFAQPPVPYDLDGFTSAAGAEDAFGIGFRIANAAGVPDVNTRFGPQRAPAWWLLRYKHRMYVDGSADASGHRAMMATLVAFGVAYDQLPVRDADFEDVAHFIRSIDVPCWPFGELDGAKMNRGERVFEEHCAECHGSHTGAAARFPDLVVPRADVGTDSLRAERFGDTEATYLNASFFGDPPLQPTGGYLAQPLLGIWARAPYFHDGSVPDLASVLRSSERPLRWRRAGGDGDGYDPDRVGFRHEQVAEPGDPNTRDGRLTYDTTRAGMSAAGHLYGDALGDDERVALLEYLRGL